MFNVEAMLQYHIRVVMLLACLAGMTFHADARKLLKVPMQGGYMLLNVCLKLTQSEELKDKYFKSILSLAFKHRIESCS